MPISQSIYFSDRAQEHLEHLAATTGESLSMTARRCIMRTSAADLLSDMLAELETRKEEAQEQN